MLVDLCCLLKNGQIPDLLLPTEQKALLSYFSPPDSEGDIEIAEDEGEPAHQGGERPPSHAQLLELVNRIKRSVKAVVSLAPNGVILNRYMRKHQTLIDCSTLIWMDAWPDEGFREVGKLCL